MSICPSSDSSPHVEGDQWNLTPCLKCTCHRGLTLCSHQHCPPAPCEAPQLDEISCCPRCLSHSPTSKITNSSSSSPTIQHDWPSNNNELLDIRQGGENDEDDDDEDGGENRNVITNRSSHSHKKKGNCVSDDSHKEYSHGDSWKVISIYDQVCSTHLRTNYLTCSNSAPFIPFQVDFSLPRFPVLRKNVFRSRKSSFSRFSVKGKKPLIVCGVDLMMIMWILLYTQIYPPRRLVHARVVFVRMGKLSAFHHPQIVLVLHVSDLYLPRTSAVPSVLVSVRHL